MKECSGEDENDRCCRLAHHHSALLPFFLPSSSRQPSASRSSSPTHLTEQAHTHFLQHSPSSRLQRRASAALKSHTHSTFLRISSHTPAVTAGVQAAVSVLWSRDFGTSWWFREKRWWLFRDRGKKVQRRAGRGWVDLEHRVYTLCPWWLNTPVSCAGPPGRRAPWKRRSKRRRKLSDSAAAKCR